MVQECPLVEHLLDVVVGVTHVQVCAGACLPEGHHLDGMLKVTPAQACAGIGHLVVHLLCEVVGVTHAQACAGAGNPVEQHLAHHLVQVEVASFHDCSEAHCIAGHPG